MREAGIHLNEQKRSLVEGRLVASPPPRHAQLPRVRRVAA
ncbi:MAG: hypothetical protein IPK33_10895 [Gemmatimonadetes bacterium]|nr:hypothetical protein [Gemmatimonadota bacterium]